METTRLSLPNICDLAAATTLHEILVPLQDMDIELDASQVERLSTPAAQLIAAARHVYARRGHSCTVVAPSPEFSSAMIELGLEELLGKGDCP